MESHRAPLGGEGHATETHESFHGEDTSTEMAIMLNSGIIPRTLRKVCYITHQLTCVSIICLIACLKMKKKTWLLPTSNLRQPNLE